MGTPTETESRTPTKLDTGTDQLLCSLEDGVATITLNRPERRNALSDQLTPALRQTLLTVEADPAVRCVVITGAGRAFCAGGDVSGMGGNADAGPRPPAQTSLQDAVRRLKHGQETLTLRLFDLAKPTIAALPGPAAGANGDAEVAQLGGDALHHRRGLDDRGLRVVQPAAIGRVGVGLDLADPRFVHQLEVRTVRLPARLEHLQQPAVLTPSGKDELSDAPNREAVFVAVCRHATRALSADLRFERPLGVVNARMENT